MKKLILLLTITLFYSKSQAQSTEILPGQVIPQMTTSQRLTNTMNTDGLLVFDTDEKKYYYLVSNSWTEISIGTHNWISDGNEGDEIRNVNNGGFWSSNVSRVVNDEVLHPPVSPINGKGTRLMWIPSRSAFRVGTVSIYDKAWEADSIGIFSFATGFDTKATNAYTTSLGFKSSATGYQSTSIGLSAKSYETGSIALGSFSSAKGPYSMALNGGTAKGNSSVAIGSGSEALGESSTAISSTTAFGVHSFSTGDKTYAYGRNSATFGLESTAVGNYSLSMGYRTFASGIGSLSQGNGSGARGENAVAFGYKSEADGNNSLSLGSMNIADGVNSIAGGEDSKALGKHSLAFGKNTQTRVFAGVVFGENNDTTDTPSSTFTSDYDRVMQVGNGFSESNRSNALTILYNGYTGINTAYPDAGLHIMSTTDDWDRHIRLQYDDTQYGNILYDNDGMKFRMRTAGDSFYFRNSLNATVAQINENGNTLFAGTVSQNSDRRLKKNIKPLNNSSTALAQLSGYHYNWKSEKRDQSLQTGLIAQEVQKVLPELVSKDEEGMLSVNYSGFIPHLIESNKDLQNQNTELLERLTALESEMSEIKALLTARSK